MKRILGVAGSPRKNGNTHILVKQILKGAGDGGADVETVFLADLCIRECDGCHLCWEGKECSKADDMAKLYPRIIESDIVVFGTPVYWYGPSGLMKLFIDRFVYFNCPPNREKIRGKGAIIAVPFEDESMETAALLVTWFEKCFSYLEMNLLENLIVPGVTRRGEILERDNFIQEAYMLGRRAANMK